MNKAKARISISLLSLLASSTFLHAEPITLTMWSQETNGVTTQIVEEFNKSHDDIKIDLASRDFSSLVSDLIRAFATGNAPDIVEIDNPEIAVFSSRGVLLDLTDMAANAKYFDLDAMVPGMRDAGTWDGRLYAIPKAANTIALYYNADLFKTAGLDPNNPPKNWSELSDYAARLNDPANKIAGLSFSAAANEEGTFQFLPFVQMAGSGFDTLNSEGSVKALTLWRDLYQSGNVTADAISMGQWDLTAIFNSGGTAMHVSGPWELSRMSETATFDWRVALLPPPDDSDSRSSALGEFMHGINAKSKHPKEAFEFIDWYHTQDKELWNKFGVIPGFDVKFEVTKHPAAYKAFSEQIKYADVRGPHPQWPKISKAIQTAIQSALTGQAEPKEALDIAASAVSKILAK